MNKRNSSRFKDFSLETASRLKLLREEKGLSHSGLSKTLSEKYGIAISRDSLISYEVINEEHAKVYSTEGMKVEYLRCFADFYCVSTDYLLGLTEIRAADTDTRSVCEFTGLSEEAANFMYELKNAPTNQLTIKRILPMINSLLEMPRFFHLLRQVSQYYDAAILAENTEMDPVEKLVSVFDGNEIIMNFSYARYLDLLGSDATIAFGVIINEVYKDLHGKGMIF